MLELKLISKASLACVHCGNAAAHARTFPVIQMDTAAKPRRALVVDDEEKIVEILSRYLSDEGFIVATSCDGADALRKALAEPFDVILLDLNLPSMSGVEVFKAVRRSSDVPAQMKAKGLLATSDTAGGMITAWSGSSRGDSSWSRIPFVY